MNKFFKRGAAILLAASLLTMAGCNKGGERPAAGSEASDSTTATTTAETSPEPETSETPESTKATAAPDITSEDSTADTSGPEETTAEPVEYPAPDEMPERLFVEDFIAPGLKGKAADIAKASDEFTQNNVFYDFTLTYDAEPSPIPEELQEKVIRSEMEASTYSIQDFETVAAYDDTKDFVCSDGENKYIKPKFIRGYENDFDGDGKTERFLVVSSPEEAGERYVPVYRLYFENSEGRRFLVDTADADEGASIIDYGGFKQFIFGADSPIMGVRSHHSIYAVENGNVKTLYEGRVGYEKWGCFVFYGGWMGASGLLIFDTNTREYREVDGFPADMEKLRALDRDHVLELTYPEEEGATYAIIIGERYVISPMDQKSYRYENGSFTDTSDVLMFYYPFYYNGGEFELFDIDIDYALSASGATLE